MNSESATVGIFLFELELCTAVTADILTISSGLTYFTRITPSQKKSHLLQLAELSLNRLGKAHRCAKGQLALQPAQPHLDGERACERH